MGVHIPEWVLWVGGGLASLWLLALSFAVYGMWAAGWLGDPRPMKRTRTIICAALLAVLVYAVWVRG